MEYIKSIELTVRNLQFKNENLRTESVKSIEKIKEMNRIINFEKVNLESSKEDNINKMVSKITDLERKVIYYQNLDTNNNHNKIPNNI